MNNKKIFDYILNLKARLKPKEIIIWGILAAQASLISANPIDLDKADFSPITLNEYMGDAIVDDSTNNTDSNIQLTSFTGTDIVDQNKIIIDQDIENKSKIGKLIYNIANNKVVKAIVGKPAQDAIVLDMFSEHLSPTNNNLNESHHMRGFQYKGLSYAKFENSHNRETNLIGFSRNIKSFSLTKNFRVDLGYKAGIVDAYRNTLPTIGDWALGIIPVLGLNYKHLGLDIWYAPLDHGVITTSIRLNLIGDHKPQYKRPLPVPTITSNDQFGLINAINLAFQ